MTPASVAERATATPRDAIAGVGKRTTTSPAAERNVDVELASGMRIAGHVSDGFEPVRDAFVENFSRRGELGGACCVYLRGDNVVDLWGGVRNAATGEAWEEDTMVLVHSATKGLAAMTLALAHSRGWLDYDERVAAYWSEFAQAGKARVTVRQLLAHQAGLYALDVPVDRALLADLDRLAAGDRLEVVTFVGGG